MSGDESSPSSNRLWAPWRLSYIKGAEGDEPSPPEPSAWCDDAVHDCFLCRAAAEYGAPASADRANLVVCRAPGAVALLNRYPYSNGHLLVSPARHVAELGDLTDDEHLALMRLVTRYTTLLAERLTAQGCNVGLNLGRVAGAGVPGHLHWHLVPRWTGDHNFMATTAGARVIPQALDAAWELLCDS
ncbi:AP-4-A phosphorylase [Pseudobythopirellula maris]|uniref:AP-4-A phosphorylase n=1 Tax=Pseudobythopirellula maris TaxID=2527991 RepID=A0A5C5ZPP2_9BACT|nr:HIT domain-containing protein [Pseudobythopirellula maris]TWT88761.1 AP-4-A phosphorylase [Pseudobythopirellula maris]